MDDFRPQTPEDRLATQLDGRVLAVSGSFMGGHVPGMAAPGKVVPQIMYEFWMRAVGSEPAFYPARDKDYDQEATDQNNSLVGSWERKKLQDSTHHLVMMKVR